MKIIALVLAAIFLSSTPVFSQQAKSDIEVCSTAVDKSGMTGCEQAVIENFLLKQAVIQAQNAQLEAQYKTNTDGLAKTVTLIESKHPGMTYNPPSQQFPTGVLVKKPEPAPKAEEKKTEVKK